VEARTVVDVLVWCSGATRTLKDRVHERLQGTLSICWIPHHTNEPAVGGLKDLVYDFDIFAFVSEWQRDQYIDTFGIPTGKTMIMLNGNSPAFRGDFDVAAKKPIFLYTSQPDRGLEVLARAWPRIAEKHPTAELHTYSSRKTYGINDDPAIVDLLSHVATLPRATVHTPISQADLAIAAREAAFFAYPANFYETGCIACTEACAAGCLPIVSDLGVLGSYFSNALRFDETLEDQFVERACIFMDLFETKKDVFCAQSERIAARFQEERDYTRLVSVFEERVQVNLAKKAHAVSTFQKAQAFYAVNNFKQARLYLANMEPLFERKEHAFAYWLWMGVCYYHEKRAQAALSAFEKANVLSNTLQLCVNMILVNELLGNTAEMIKWCEQSLTHKFDIQVINKILNAVHKLPYFDRCKWGRYLLSLWNNDIQDVHWMSLFLSHGNMIVGDYTLTMKHEEGFRLMNDLIAKGLAFAELHKIDLRGANMTRNNLEKLFSNLFLNANYYETNNPTMGKMVEYYNACLAPLHSVRKPTFAPIRGGRKLRIGFVSGDLVYHPVSYVLNGIVEHMDKSKFEVYIFSTTRRDETNKLQNKMRADVTEFCDLEDNVEVITDKILEKDLDILIEMCGHTTNGTTLINVLRNKPARIVAQYFAFPNTYGLSCVDYKIGDKVVFPMGLDRYYTEKFCMLEGGFHTYKPILDIELKPVLHTDIVFGCFNNPKKFRPDWIRAVSQILKKVPDSRLKLRYFNLNDPSIREFYLKEFEKHGVDRERVDIGLGESLLRYFEAYADVDIVLDPWPYNGGTINIESLYCGRPYITVLGNSYVSRVGASLLHQVGLPELIAKNAEEYVAKAVELAGDWDRLQGYHKSIRSKMMKSSLGDNKAFTAEFERGLTWMLKEKKWI
jgi:predicted O-linked N-acetylglucosamine transferase (SPINDLY family)